MLRIAIGDVPSMRVIRDDELTLIVRPAVIDRDTGVAESRLLLSLEEAAIVRAAMGVCADGDPADRYLGLVPEESCPCYIPRRLRSPLDVSCCPLHSDLAAALA